MTKLLTQILDTLKAGTDERQDTSDVRISPILVFGVLELVMLHAAPGVALSMRSETRNGDESLYIGTLFVLEILSAARTHYRGPRGAGAQPVVRGA